MKLALAVVVVALLALAWRLNSTNATLVRQQQTLNQQQQQIQTLTTALANKSKQEALALQEKCAVQSEKVFRERHITVAHNELLQYESHYNPTLGKCFISFTREMYLSGAKTSHTLDVQEAFGLRTYGEFLGFSTTGLSGSSMWSCWVLDQEDTQHPCKTFAEYELLIKRYTE